MKAYALIRNYRSEYRRNLTLAMPVVLSQLGQVFVQFADNLMVARLGAVPLAAVSFASVVFFMFFLAGMGLTLGLTPLVGEAYARGRYREVAGYLQNGIGLFGVTGVLLLAGALAIVPLLGHMGQPVEVAEMAVGYYKYIAWSILPFMLFAPFKQFLEGLGNTVVVMVVVLSGNLLNIILNYVFIYGHWGAPEMGAAGAGLATLISRALMPVAILLWVTRKERFARYLRFFSKANFSAERLRSLLKVGSPISVQMLLEFTAFGGTSVMMGWLGAVPLAGNQIAITLVNCTFMVVIGVAAATTIRVSHEFGRGDLRALRRAAYASYHMVIVYALVAAVIFISMRHLIPLIFTPDPEVVAVTARLLIFAGIFQLSDGLQNISVGILRGMQDVHSVMWIAFFSYVVVNLPVSYLLAFKLGMGPGGLWAGFIFGLTLAAVLLYTRFRRLLNRLRRAQRCGPK